MHEIEKQDLAEFVHALRLHIIEHPCLLLLRWEIYRPFGVVVGGEKVAEKLQLIKSLLAVANSIFVGGLVAFTLLAAQGLATGATYIKAAWLNLCKDLLESARQRVSCYTDDMCSLQSTMQCTLSSSDGQSTALRLQSVRCPPLHALLSRSASRTTACCGLCRVLPFTCQRMLCLRKASQQRAQRAHRQ